MIATNVTKSRIALQQKRKERMSGLRDVASTTPGRVGVVLNGRSVNWTPAEPAGLQPESGGAV
jgi:hypothetical protein